ncbi:hypothetical protein ACH5RR_034012 [Cinchona calisaya]|uniref:Uncharacterized protein n=1 Tax=Cinchona calisaya TaxID=153742 RepID=A0ABD2Y9N5_9GENT
MNKSINETGQNAHDVGEGSRSDTNISRKEEKGVELYPRKLNWRRKAAETVQIGSDDDEGNGMGEDDTSGGKMRGSEDGLKRRKVLASDMGADSSKSDEVRRNEDDDYDDPVPKLSTNDSQKEKKLPKRGSDVSPDLNFIKTLLDSKLKKGATLEEKPAPVEEKATSQNVLPLKFRFEDEDPASPEKEECEIEIDNLFAEMEMFLSLPDPDCTRLTTAENDDATAIAKTSAERCQLGVRQLVLEEPLGIVSWLVKTITLPFLMKALYRILFLKILSELTAYEEELAEFILQKKGSAKKARQYAKLYCWWKERSVLGTSYQLFEQLASRRINELQQQSQGAERQCAKRRWDSLTNAIDKKFDKSIEELKAMIDPFSHVYEGTILQDRLPGLKDTLIILRPTEQQKRTI